MNVGLIGAGVQGWRRAKALKEDKEVKVKMVAAHNKESASKLANWLDCKSSQDWRKVTENDEVEVVLVCVPNAYHARISIAAMKNGKHVLCEKPLATTLNDASLMIETAKKMRVKLRAGFNHRHHPSVRQVYDWYKQGRLGRIMLIRSVYGICGRLGYEKEWRANPKLAGGGQFLEQGIHCVDLFRLFLDKFSTALGVMSTLYWDIAPLEDNGLAIYKTEQGQTAFLHASLTEWKNLFSLEVFGEDGYGISQGLGGSYGTERATFGRRIFSRPFEEETIEFRGEDPCWKNEWKYFKDSLKEEYPSNLMADGTDGYESMKMVFAAYESAKSGRTVDLTSFNPVGQT